MTLPSEAHTIKVDTNPRVFFLYGAVLLIILGFFIGFSLINEKFIYLIPILAVPIGIAVITHPKWALYLFVFCLFIRFPLNWNVSISLTDISGILLVFSAIMDILLSNKIPRHFPHLFFNFAFLLTAIIVTGVFAYEPVIALQPLSRILLMTVIFLALIRLVDKVGVEKLVRLFFLFAIFHSIIVLTEFILSSGLIRSFGLLPRHFDDLAMLALPIGIVFYLWSKRGRAVWYAISSILIFGALLATQSRTSIFFSLLFSFFAVFVVFKQIGKTQVNLKIYKKVKTYLTMRFLTKRLALFLLSGLALFCITLVLYPSLFSMVIERFAEAMSLETERSLGMRFELWRVAWLAFTTHPFIGIGPGKFRTIIDIFYSLHTNYSYFWVRGLSAHNPFLHYLAETGLIGTSTLIALFVNNFRLGYKQMAAETKLDMIPISQILFVMSLTFLITLFFEGGWMWGHNSITFVFFLALVACRVTPRYSTM